MKLSQWPKGNKKLPPLEALRVLEAVVRAGGFARAGSILNLTPNAVAHQVTKLEEWFGFELFRRHARGITAIPETEEFAENIRQLLGGISVASDELARQMTSSVVNISAMPSLVTKWLLPILGSLYKAAPDTKFRVQATPEFADFERESIDLEVREGAGPWAGLAHDVIMPEWWAPVCSASYVSEKGLSSVEDLASCTLLHDEPWYRTPDQVLWEGWCERLALPAELGSEHLWFSHTYLSIQAAIAGQGIALGNLALVTDDLLDGRLVAPFGQWIRGPYDFNLVYAETGLAKQGMSSVRDWVLDCSVNHCLSMAKAMGKDVWSKV
ncbi:LysR substrate-binding domain-containing protein [Kordiimonas gwangyangensis]|uniref:LysR substrate-binding domain-containing protein n=1 Tax=Kordiimonas gwangyangensis TaxID=288022 RepID=UPI00037167EA|nr:LysR substrate-binding domain-containing protein [Kordiimonas gwangyangensis]